MHLRARELSLSHRRDMAGEVRRRHQCLAALEAVGRIGPEIIDGILVGVLDEAPERPQKIAHRLVDDDAPAL